VPLIRVRLPGDPRLAEYAGLTDPELIRSHGLFAAEGRLVVARVLADPRYVVRSVLVSEAACRALGPLLDSLGQDVPVYLAPAADFVRITGVDIHRGCLALVERPAPLSPARLIAAAGTLVVLEAVANADNVGSIFRSTLALGGDGVLLSPTCCDPLYRKAIRTSMGATLSVPFARADVWPDGLDAVAEAGFTLVALTPDSAAMTIDAFAATRPQGPLALLVGVEGSGLSTHVLERAACRVRVPMRRGIDSLNVAVAAAIALHRLVPEVTT
jgi:tRNA G18 (ribose-2'-O)-methylase SpoU